MKKIIFFCCLGALALSACIKSDSYQKEDASAFLKTEIGVRPMGGTLTRSVISGTAFPEGYDMMVSTYHNAGTGETSSTYFQGVAFSYNATSDAWKPMSGVKYFPLRGTLDFLAVACAGYNTASSGIVPTAVWGESDNAAKKVVLTVPDNSGKFDDLLYSSLNAQVPTMAGLPMVFHHAMTSVVFLAKCNTEYNEESNVGITINSITLDGAKYSGMLTVTNPAAGGGSGVTSAEWSSLGDAKAHQGARVWDSANSGVNASEPELLDLHLGKTAATLSEKPFGEGYVILPAQASVPITVNYTVHNGFDAGGATLNTAKSYTFTPTASLWSMGKKYVYELDFQLSEILISPTVVDWDQQAVEEQEVTEQEDSGTDTPVTVFDIQLGGTWNNGDVVYAFFEDNTTQYVKMTYNGTSWAYTDNVGGTSFTGLSLTASGKKVSAVYMPGFVCSATPSYATDKWTFGSVDGYFRTAEGVAYSTTTTAGVTTVSATFSLAAPSDISQVFIPSASYSAPASGNEHVLTATHMSSFVFNGIAPGGAATYTNAATYGFPLTAYSGTIGSDAGCYFWGILEGAGTYDFAFQLVERNASKKYAIASKSKSVADETVASRMEMTLSGLTDNGRFVSLGYDGGPLWATGNLDKTNNAIVDPLEFGEHFMYGCITPYNADDTPYTGNEERLPTDHDAAYQANNAWRTPTKAQLEALIDGSNTTNTRVLDFSALGSDTKGFLFTSRANGISLLIPAAGEYIDGDYADAGRTGDCWSSTPATDPEIEYEYGYGYDLFFEMDLGGLSFFKAVRNFGYSVRPVKE